MKPQRFFISGIGTGVGKTIAAAMLCQHFKANYWKPIQSGDLEASDSMQVAALVAKHIHIYPERYRLQFPASPHQSAAMEDIQIGLDDFTLPDQDKSLIVEGAGGLMVPLNQQDLMMDLIVRLQLPLILVIKDYLGCINHSLLSLLAIAQKNIPLAYVVFNGDFNPASRSAITQHIPPNTGIISLASLTSLDKNGLNNALSHCIIP